MPLLDNDDRNDDIDDILETWEKIRSTHIPSKAETISEAITREYNKSAIDDIAHNVRVSRLENNSDNLLYFKNKLQESYKQYHKDLMHRILKNG